MAIATAEADRAGQLLDQIVAVVVGEFEPGDVVRAGRVLDVVVDVGEPAPVCLACLIVEVQSGVATVARRECRVAGCRHRRQ